MCIVQQMKCKQHIKVSVLWSFPQGNVFWRLHHVNLSGQFKIQNAKSCLNFKAYHLCLYSPLHKVVTFFDISIIIK